MKEASNNNVNLANATRGIKLFSGKDPTLFENWYEKTSIMWTISRPGIHNVMEGILRPTEETSAETAPLARRQAA